MWMIDGVNIVRVRIGGIRSFVGLWVTKSKEGDEWNYRCRKAVQLCNR